LKLPWPRGSAAGLVRATGALVALQAICAYDALFDDFKLSTELIEFLFGPLQGCHPACIHLFIELTIMLSPPLGTISAVGPGGGEV
jgi:hypothetical protein